MWRYVETQERCEPMYISHQNHQFRRYPRVPRAIVNSGDLARENHVEPERLLQAQEKTLLSSLRVCGRIGQICGATDKRNDELNHRGSTREPLYSQLPLHKKAMRGRSYRRRGGQQSSSSMMVLAFCSMMLLWLRAQEGLVTDSSSAIDSGESKRGEVVDAAQDEGLNRNNSHNMRNNSSIQDRRQGDVQSDKGGVGIVVVVMPSPPMVSGPMTRIDRLRAIRETWGRDLIFGKSPILGDHASPMDHSNHRVVFVIDEKDPAAADALTEWKPLNSTSSQVDARIFTVPSAISSDGADGDARLRHVLGTVSSTYEPDFLFFCNEHTFVIAENLRCFVAGLDPSKPVYLGNRFRKEEKPAQEEAFLNSGAAGFVLSRGSLSLLREAWGQVSLPDGVNLDGEWDGVRTVPNEPVAECTAKSQFERNNPGVTLARCLKHLGVEAEDTTDSQGGQRFNAYGPVRLAQGKIDPWYKDVHASNPGMWHSGPRCCSSDTISFHYVGPAEARAMHHILHNGETYRYSQDFREARIIWPTVGRDLGAYSVAPRSGDATFDLLLRKIVLCPTFT